MKAFPSLFVGLAAVLTGCSTSNLQPHSPAGLQPVLQPDSGLPSLGAPVPIADVYDNVPTIPDPNVMVPRVELGRASSTPPPLAADPDAESARTVTSQSARPDAWRAAFESHQRRPIHTLHAGEGERRVFVTASLHGDDAESVRLIDAITNQLTAETPASRCVFLRSLNPDGLAASQPWNANGVDLNQNFPSLRFVPFSDGRNGAAPASETETRIMLRVLGDFQPHRVIQIRTDEVPVIRAYANAAGESELGRVLDGLRIERGDFEQIAAVGSLEEFTSQRLRAEMVTVVVPVSMARHRETVDTLLTLCTGSPASETHPEQRPENSSPTPIAVAEPVRGPAALTGDLELFDRDGAHGYVEFLPPPPESESGTDRPGFYELPPPL